MREVIMPLKTLAATLISGLVQKTFTRKGIEENAHQPSTKLAGVLAAVAAMPSAAELASSGALLPQTEGVLWFQIITAIGALVMYYVDERNLKQ
jgi:hypothetical protein